MHRCWVSRSCVVNVIPDTVEDRLFLGERLGDWSLGAHNLALMLLFSSLTVFVLVRLGSTILS